MSDSRSFESFSARTLGPELAILEVMRKRAAVQAVVVWGMILGGLLVVWANNEFGIPFTIWILAAFLGLGGGTWLQKELTKRYTQEFKTRIIGPLVAWLDPGLRFDPDGYMPEHAFTISRLHPGDNTSYHGEDLVSGSVDGRSLNFCEITVTRGSGRNKSTVFKGLFLEAEAGAYVEGSVVVMPDVAERMLGGLGAKLQGLTRARGGLVKFDDEAFEKRFVVYATDESVARRVLKASMRRRLLDLREQAGRDLQVSFSDGKVYVAVPMFGNAFEPSLFTRTNAAKLEEYIASARFALDLARSLRLEAA